MSNTYTIEAISTSGFRSTFTGCQWPQNKVQVLWYAENDGVVRVIREKDNKLVLEYQYTPEMGGVWFKTRIA